MIPAAPNNRAHRRAPEVHVRANYPSAIEGREPAQPCRTAPTVDVGQLSPRELDAHIDSLGNLMVRANRLGDDENAEALRRCMSAAIESRSAEHKAVIEAQIQRRIEEGVGYFSSAAANALGREGA